MTRIIYESVRAAQREVDFWISAEDFARWLAAERPSQQLGRLKLAVFTKADWIEFTYRGKKAASFDACERQFERWKQNRARPLGFVTKIEQLGGVARDAVDRVADNLPEGGALYVVRTAGLSVRVEAAIARRDDLDSKRPRRTRRVPSKQLCVILDVGRNTLNRWSERGAPIARVKKGNRTFLFADPGKLMKWIEAKSRTGEIRKGPGRPSDEDVQAAMKEASGCVADAAKILQAKRFYIKPGTLWARTKVLGIPVQSRRVIEPTDDEIFEAMEANDHRLSGASTDLGIDQSTLKKLVERRGAVLRARLYIRPAMTKKGWSPVSKKDVAEAMDEFGPSTAPAAEALDIVHGYLNQLLRKYRLTKKYEARERALLEAEWAAEEERMRVAIEAGIREGLSQKQVFGALSMNHDAFYVRLRKYGLNELARRLPRPRVRRTKPRKVRDPKANLVPFWLSALQKVVAETSGTQVAAALGATRPSVSHWSKGKPPRYAMIEAIMELAGRDMPDWKGALRAVKAEHVTQQKAADALGLGQGSFSKLMRGSQIPSEVLLQTILEVAGVPFMVPRARRKRRA